MHARAAIARGFTTRTCMAPGKKKLNDRELTHHPSPAPPPLLPSLSYIQAPKPQPGSKDRRPESIGRRERGTRLGDAQKRDKPGACVLLVLPTSTDRQSAAT